MKIPKFRIGTMLCLLWVFTSCNNISKAPLAQTPSSSPLPPTAPLTLTVPTTPQVELTQEVPSPSPTLTTEQAQEMIGELLSKNAGCTTPCFWGFRPLSSVEENKVLGYFSFLREKPRTVKENGDTQYIVSIGYKDRINMSISFTFDDEQHNLINIYSAIHGLYYPEVNIRDWEAFRPETILETYGKPSSIEFFLSYPTEPTSDNTVGYEFLFHYAMEKFTVKYTGQRTLNESQLHVCPLDDPTIESVYLFLGDNLINQPGHGKAIEQISSLTIDDLYNNIIENKSDACLSLDRAAFNQQ